MILAIVVALCLLIIVVSFFLFVKFDIESDFEAAEKDFQAREKDYLMRKHLEEFNRGSNRV